MSRKFRVNMWIVGKDAERFALVYDRIMQATLDEAQMAHIILELIGLRPPKLTTEEDRRILSHGTAAPIVTEEQVRERLRGKGKKGPHSADQT